VDPEVIEQICAALSITRDDIVHHQWVDNGPGWCAVMLRSARDVLDLRVQWPALAPLKLGVIGPHDAGHDAAFEVRAFIGDGGYEDPVTGSLNASLAQWLTSTGLAASSYVASQGTVLQRAGRVHLQRDGDTVWVGGDVVDVVAGEIAF
jgi:predicted PhzF superfamily epimerase YddE/YHI9